MSLTDRRIGAARCGGPRLVGVGRCDCPSIWRALAGASVVSAGCASCFRLAGSWMSWRKASWRAEPASWLAAAVHPACLEARPRQALLRALSVRVCVWHVSCCVPTGNLPRSDPYPPRRPISGPMRLLPASVSMRHAPRSLSPEMEVRAILCVCHIPVPTSRTPIAHAAPAHLASTEAQRASQSLPKQTRFKLHRH